VLKLRTKAVGYKHTFTKQHPGAKDLHDQGESRTYTGPTQAPTTS